MANANISGVGVALVTPFNDDLSIDFESLEKIIKHVISGGADFLVVLGTTGESSLLTQSERNEVISFVREIAAGRLPLVLGYGGICTAQLAEGFKDLDVAGYSAILSVTPFYVKPSQKGLFEHYTTLAYASPLPLILYNVPGRTGVNMEPDTTLSLAEHPNIMGVKEASGKLFQIEEIMMRKTDDFLLFSGDDALTFHLVNAGANGVISVMANAFPKEISKIVKSPQDRLSIAMSNHFLLKTVTKAAFADGNPCGIKYILSRLGLCKNNLRLPLVPVSPATEETINKELDKLTGK